RFERGGGGHFIRRRLSILGKIGLHWIGDGGMGRASGDHMTRARMGAAALTAAAVVAAALPASNAVATTLPETTYFYKVTMTDGQLMVSPKHAVRPVSLGVFTGRNSSSRPRNL